MIKNHPRRTVPALVAGILFTGLASLVVLQPTRAGETAEATLKTQAVEAMEGWLAGIDAGKYAASWKDASKMFKGAVTESQWEAALTSVRTPLGKLQKRELASALHQTEVPRPPEEPLKGEFVIAQFRSSFENLHAALETVTFERESDGQWRAAGYFVAPGS